MKEAKLFTSGQHQAVQLPKEFHFRGKSVYIRRLGDAVMLLPHHQPWSVLINSCGRFTDDFMSHRTQGAQERKDPSA